MHKKSFALDESGCNFSKYKITRITKVAAEIIITIYLATYASVFVPWLVQFSVQYEPRMNKHITVTIAAVRCRSRGAAPRHYMTPPCRYSSEKIRYVPRIQTRHANLIKIQFQISFSHEYCTFLYQNQVTFTLNTDIHWFGLLLDVQLQVTPTISMRLIATYSGYPQARESVPVSNTVSPRVAACRHIGAYTLSSSHWQNWIKLRRTTLWEPERGQVNLSLGILRCTIRAKAFEIKRLALSIPYLYDFFSIPQPHRQTISSSPRESTRYRTHAPYVGRSLDEKQYKS